METRLSGYTDAELAVLRARSAINVKDAPYNAVGDGVTDDTAAIQAAINADAGPVLLPAGRYKLTGYLSLLDGTILRGVGSSTVLYVTADAGGAETAYLAATGTDGTKTALDANQDAGDETITLPTGGGAAFDAGDYVGVESTAIVAGTDNRAREIHKIISVAGDVLTLDASLVYTYNTADTAQYWKMTPLTGIEISDLAFEDSDPTDHGNYAIFLNKVANYRIDRVTLTNMSGGIGLYDAIDGHSTGVLIDRLPNYGDARGYGILVGGASANLVVDGLRGRGCRHVFTTLAEQRAGPTYWGGPFGITINGGVAVCDSDSLAAWDTHEGGRYITYNSCIAIGGGTDAAHYQIRAQYVTLNNCISHRAGHRSVNISGPDAAANARIHGGDFGFSKTAGAIAISGTDCEVVDATIHDAASMGIAVNGTDCSIRGCLIRNNTTYAIQDLGSTRLTVVGNVAPKSAAQTVGITGATATATIKDNILLGYGGYAFSATNAGATIVDNVTEEFANEAIASSATISTLNNSNDVVSITGTADITSITASHPGRRITLVFSGTAATNGLVDGSNLKLASTLAYTPDDTITLVCDGTSWYEVSRSVN